MHYTWRIEEEDKFFELYGLVRRAKLNWSTGDVERRIRIPLFLGQLIGFYDEKDSLRGFLTVAFMDHFCEQHMRSIGILPTDWRCGGDFWVVDLVAPEGDGDKMLIRIVRDLKGTAIETVRYFRGKYRELREVHIA